MTKERQTERALVPKAEKAVITWQGRNITITFDDVKNRICPKADDQEIIVFLRMCDSLNLNPWERDIWMVKYTEQDPASYIVAHQAFLKASELCEEYDGHEAGIVVLKPDGGLDFRDHAILVDEDKGKLVGGWAKVYRKDRQRPFHIAVNIKECTKYTKDGRVTRFWSSMPATMIRKVALARALREAFPGRLGSMITDAEDKEISEDTLPPAFVKDGKTNWKKFYAKGRSELGITPEQMHELVGAESFNDLLAADWTEEKIWNEIVAALQRQKTEAKSEEIVDTQTGEIITQEEDLFGEREEEATPAEAEASAKPKRDPETIKTTTDLMKACFQDYGMQPKVVLKELGYSSQTDINEKPSVCYQKIAAMRG